METNLIEFCKYYGKGDGFQKNAIAYFYEKKWVSLNGEFSLEEYSEYGLDNFNSTDGVPKTLKALLLNRFLISNGYCQQNAEMFKNWYANFYLLENYQN